MPLTTALAAKNTSSAPVSHGSPAGVRMVAMPGMLPARGIGPAMATAM
nr:hypothetical protein [Streptacidiphilus carbonis]